MRPVDQIVACGLTSQQAMQLHLHVLEELLNGLGNRSTRHIVTCSDILIVEVTINLAERFRYAVKRDDATCRVPTRHERLQ